MTLGADVSAATGADLKHQTSGICITCLLCYLLSTSWHPGTGPRSHRCLCIQISSSMWAP
jgi:hypothetical protein